MRCVVFRGGRVYPTSRGLRIRTRSEWRSRNGGGATLGRPSTPSPLRVREALLEKHPKPFSARYGLGAFNASNRPASQLLRNTDSCLPSSVIPNRGHLFRPSGFGFCLLLGRTRVFSLSILSLGSYRCVSPAVVSPVLLSLSCCCLITLGTFCSWDEF